MPDVNLELMLLSENIFAIKPRDLLVCMCVCL